MNKDKIKKDLSLESSPERSISFFKSKLRIVIMTIATATSGVFLAVYNESLSNLIKPKFSSFIELSQDKLFPMPKDKIIGVELRFYIPSSINKERNFEAISVTLPPSRCKRSGGEPIVRTFDGGERDSYTEAIVSINCSASGRTEVKLTPQSGNVVTIFNDIAEDGKQVPFPGVPGSYYAGILSIYLLDTKDPQGPRVPVNKI